MFWVAFSCSHSSSSHVSRGIRTARFYKSKHPGEPVCTASTRLLVVVWALVSHAVMVMGCGSSSPSPGVWDLWIQLLASGNRGSFPLVKLTQVTKTSKLWHSLGSSNWFLLTHTNHWRDLCLVCSRMALKCSALQKCCAITFFLVVLQSPPAWKSAEDFHLPRAQAYGSQRFLREAWQSPASDTAGRVHGCGFPSCVLKYRQRDMNASAAIFWQGGHAVWEALHYLVASQRNLVCFANKFLFICCIEATWSILSETSERK